MQGILERGSGVVASSVDFTTGRAELHVAKGWGRYSVYLLYCTSVQILTPEERAVST